MTNIKLIADSGSIIPTIYEVSYKAGFSGHTFQRIYAANGHYGKKRPDFLKVGYEWTEKSFDVNYINKVISVRIIYGTDIYID